MTSLYVLLLYLFRLPGYHPIQVADFCAPSYRGGEEVHIHTIEL